MKTTKKLSLEWGLKGLRRALKRGDNIVIIDQLRFSCTIVTAIANGFVIQPVLHKEDRTEGYFNSPFAFLDKKPRRVRLTSKNGGHLTTKSMGSDCIIYGCVLNAKAAARYIDKQNGDATLIAAGERADDMEELRSGPEKARSRTNPIYALEDLLAAGAIASFSKMRKSKECALAERGFKRSEKELHKHMKTTASHRWLLDRHRPQDTEFCSRLNLYDVVPRLYVVKGVPEIRKAL